METVQCHHSDTGAAKTLVFLRIKRSTTKVLRNNNCLYVSVSSIGAVISACHHWRSKGRTWPGTCPAKVRPAHVCASTSVVSALVKHTAGARPIPMTWLLHWVVLHMHAPVHDINIQSAAVRQGAELGSSSHAKNTGMCQYESVRQLW